MNKNLCNFLLVLFLFCSPLLPAQKLRTLSEDYASRPALRELDEVKKTTLLVVIEDEQSPEGQAMIAAFDKYWKFNKYEFITQHDVEKYMNNSQYSFFAPVKISGYPVSNASLVGYEYGYGIFKNGFFYINKPEKLHFVHAVPFRWSAVINSNGIAQKDIVACYGFTLLEMQREIATIEDWTFNPTKDFIPRKTMFDKRHSTFYLNHGEKEKEGKTILVLKSSCDESDNAASLAKNLGVDSNKVLFVSKDEITQALELTDRNVWIALKHHQEYTNGTVNIFDTSGNAKARASFDYLDDAAYKKMKKQMTRVILIAVPIMLLTIIGFVALTMKI